MGNLNHFQMGNNAQPENVFPADDASVNTPVNAPPVNAPTPCCSCGLYVCSCHEFRMAHNPPCGLNINPHI